MSIAELSERVRLERKTLTDDGAGGAVETWNLVVECWAAVRPMTGKEQEEAMRNEAELGYTVVMRYRQVSAADRLVWRGRPMNIRAVRDAGPRALYLRLDCDLGVPT